MALAGLFQGLAGQAAHPFFLLVPQGVEQAVVQRFTDRCVAQYDAFGGFQFVRECLELVLEAVFLLRLLFLAPLRLQGLQVVQAVEFLGVRAGILLIEGVVGFLQEGLPVRLQ